LDEAKVKPKLKTKILLGIFLILFVALANAQAISGTCSSVTNQCDLSINNMELCNDSPVQHTYNIAFDGEANNWFNVIPDKVTLSPNECAQLNVYTIADCYAEPGNYEADLVISNGSIERVTCFVEVTQGHAVDVEITPETQAATECELREYEITLTNNSTIENQQSENVYLNIAGLPADWHSLEADALIVSKGTPEIVNLTVQAPCDADLGEYEFEAVASLENPSFSSSDNASYLLSSGQEPVLTINAEYDACVEETIQNSILLINAGKMEDEFKISLDAPSWISLSENAVILPPEGTISLDLVFDKTQDEQKSYDAKITIESTKFNYSKEFDFTVGLQDCYNIILEKTSGDEIVCTEETPKYIFKLTNDKILPVDAKFSIDGIIGELSLEEATIAPNSTFQLDLDLNPTGLANEAQIIDRDVSVEILMDSSGSMIEKINGKNKIEVAQEAVLSFINSIGEVDLGFRVFGQGEDCEPSELLVEMNGLNTAGITDALAGMKPRGKTPIAESLLSSIDDFSGKEKYVILVSDGKETCGGDLDMAAQKMGDAGIAVYAVGFDIDEKGKIELQGIAEKTNGQYFDAGNAEELASVFHNIAAELDIIPYQTGRKTFYLNISSDNFSIREAYTIDIEDCYNGLLKTSSLNLCRGIPAVTEIRIENLGSKAQVFNLSYAPDWVSGQENIELEGENGQAFEITVSPPTDASEREIIVRASTPETSLESASPINYLGQASCYGIDLFTADNKLDVRACEGKKFTLTVENRGKVEQTVSLSSDKSYVYLDPKEITLAAGERKDVYFLISPPYDIRGKETTVTINAETDRGFSTGIEILLGIFEEGVLETEFNIEIQDLDITEALEGLDYDRVIEFGLFNDSSRPLVIKGIKAFDFKAVFDYDTPIVESKTSLPMKMYLELPEDLEAGSYPVAVEFTTDKGVYVREVVIDVAFEMDVGGEETGDGTEGEGQEVVVGTGLVSLGSMVDVAIIILVLVAIALIVYSVVKTMDKPKPKSFSDVSGGKKKSAAKKKKKPVKKNKKK